MANQPLLDVRNLSISFKTEDGIVPAVKNVSFTVNPGEGMALVGESGSGKSVTCLALTKLLPQPPAIYDSGAINLDGEDILRLRGDRLRQVRGGKIAYIFQEPSTSLNPVYSIRSQIAEAIRLHRKDVTNVDAEIVKWLDLVGIVDPERRMHDFPHQLSGGMQQRCMIAMALSCRPQLLVADEPTTALDVTIQAQIIELLKELKSKLDMSILLITHNFAIIPGLAERVAVMFRGEIVESGPTAEVLANPRHPYTKALIQCIPRLGARRKRLTTIDYSLLEAKA